MPELTHPEMPTITIVTHEDYRRALLHLNRLQVSASGKVDGLLLASLSAAIAAYEARDKGPGARG